MFWLQTILEELTILNYFLLLIKYCDITDTVFVAFMRIMWALVSNSSFPSGKSSYVSHSLALGGMDCGKHYTHLFVQIVSWVRFYRADSKFSSIVVIFLFLHVMPIYSLGIRGSIIWKC